MDPLLTNAEDECLNWERIGLGKPASNTNPARARQKVFLLPFIDYSVAFGRNVRGKSH